MVVPIRGLSRIAGVFLLSLCTQQCLTVCGMESLTIPVDDKNTDAKTISTPTPTSQSARLPGTRYVLSYWGDTEFGGDCGSNKPSAAITIEEGKCVSMEDARVWCIINGCPGKNIPNIPYLKLAESMRTDGFNWKVEGYEHGSCEGKSEFIIASGSTSFGLQSSNSYGDDDDISTCESSPKYSNTAWSVVRSDHYPRGLMPKQIFKCYSIHKHCHMLSSLDPKPSWVNRATASTRSTSEVTTSTSSSSTSASSTTASSSISSSSSRPSSPGPSGPVDPTRTMTTTTTTSTSNWFRTITTTQDYMTFQPEPPNCVTTPSNNSMSALDIAIISVASIVFGALIFGVASKAKRGYSTMSESSSASNGLHKSNHYESDYLGSEMGLILPNSGDLSPMKLLATIPQFKMIYLNPSSCGQVGFSIDQTQGGLVVESVDPAGTAGGAGVKENMLIVSINNMLAISMSKAEANRLLSANTPISLVVVEATSRLSHRVHTDSTSDRETDNDIQSSKRARTQSPSNVPSPNENIPSPADSYPSESSAGESPPGMVPEVSRMFTVVPDLNLIENIFEETNFNTPLFSSYPDNTNTSLVNQHVGANWYRPPHLPTPAEAESPPPGVTPLKLPERPLVSQPQSKLQIPTPAQNQQSTPTESSEIVVKEESESVASGKMTIRFERYIPDFGVKPRNSQPKRFKGLDDADWQAVIEGATKSAFGRFLAVGSGKTGSGNKSVLNSTLARVLRSEGKYIPLDSSAKPCFLVQRENQHSKAPFHVKVAGTRMVAQKAVYAMYNNLESSEIGTWQVEQTCGQRDNGWWCFEPSHLKRCTKDHVKPGVTKHPIPGPPNALLTS